jgi:hypothetical protein
MSSEKKVFGISRRRMYMCVCARAASPDAPTPMISTAAASSPVTTFPFDGISLHAVQPNPTKLSL